MNKYIESSEINFKIDTKHYTKFRALKEGNEVFIESGDSTFPLVHWLFLRKEEAPEIYKLLSRKFENGFVWESGNVKLYDILKTGDSCTCKYSIEETETKTGGMELSGLKLNIRIFRKNELIVEEHSILKPLKKENNKFSQKRRLDFDPDWEIKMTDNELATAGKFRPELFGLDGVDLLSNPEKSNEKYAISGPVSLMILVDSFQHHFTNRVIEDIEYHLYAVEMDDELFLTAKDTDAYETVLSITNKKRQMLFRVKVKWIYVW